VAEDRPSQAERIQTMRMKPDLYERVEQYADDNALSVSEALREILTSYANGETTPPERKRRSRRVAIWIDPIEWQKFRVRALNDKVSITDAIEAAVEDSL